MQGSPVLRSYLKKALQAGSEGLHQMSRWGIGKHAEEDDDDNDVTTMMRRSRGVGLVMMVVAMRTSR